MTAPRKCSIPSCPFHGANGIAAVPMVWLCTAHLLDWMGSQEFKENKRRFVAWMALADGESPPPDAPVDLVSLNPWEPKP